MLQHLKLANVLFLDIETVPVVASFQDLPEKFKILWEKKAEQLKRNDNNLTADKLFEKAGIYAEFGKIVCISCGYENGKEFRIKSFYGDDEAIILQEFADMLNKYYSEDKLLVQYTTADEVLRLPAASIYSSNYWRQSLFKGALITTIGFDLSYTTKYKASAYMPATGVFHLQNEYDVGAYPFLDAFLAFKIARTRIFISYNNLLSGVNFIGNNYFTSYRYPMKPRHFRLGLEWTFYD